MDKSAEYKRAAQAAADRMRAVQMGWSSSPARAAAYLAAKEDQLRLWEAIRREGGENAIPSAGPISPAIESIKRDIANIRAKISTMGTGYH